MWLKTYNADLLFRGILRCLFQISSQILLLKSFKIFLEGNIWNDNFRNPGVLPDKLIAMVTPDNLGNQFPPPERLNTVVKNILEGYHDTPPPLHVR